MRRHFLVFCAVLAVLTSAMQSQAACTAGNPNSAVAEATPDSDFSINGDGTVTHARTGLMWKQCAEGLDQTCSGTPTQLNWASALTAATLPFAGYNDWRLPNKKELESIVEFCGASPAINQNAFPGTPNFFFWSATTYLPDPTQAWIINSDDGATGFDPKTAGTYYTRLVRGGQVADSFDGLKSVQTISFGAQVTQVYGAAPFALNPAATASSGLAVSYQSTTPSVCTVAGSIVTIVAAGTCTIAADQAGDASYNAAPRVTQDIAIGKADQTITFGAQAGQSFGVAPFALNPAASASSGLPISYSSLTGLVCTISGTTVSVLAVGTCTIAANQSGNGTYNAALQATQDIVIGKSDQTISFGAQAGQILGNAPFALNPLASASSGLAVSYTTQTAPVCTVAGTTVTIVTVGTCTIAANQAGNSSYNAAPQVTQNILISAAASAPSATSLSASAIDASSATLNGSVSDNGAATTVSFDYGLTAAYGTNVGASSGGTVNAGAGNTAVALTISGLSCNTSYHFRVKAVNSVNTTNGGDLSFTTSACAPTASTTAASAIGLHSATLNGIVNANGATTSVSFDYGLSTAYGTQAAASPATVAANAGSTVALSLSGLSCNTPYHYRVNGTNSAGTTNGNDQTFTTLACSSTVPGAPTIQSAIAGPGRATVSFAAPVSNGGLPINGYSASCTAPAQITHTMNGAASPISVGGLKGGVVYTCSVTATNGIGTGAASGSLPVTPQAGTMPGLLPSVIMLLLE